MPDTETTQEEPTGEVETEATDKESTASNGATESESTGEEAEAQPKIDWRELIRDVPPEDLLKGHDSLKQHVEGRAGQMAQRLAREKYLPEALAERTREIEDRVRAETDARLTQQRKEERLDRITERAEEDPEWAVKELRKLREEEKSAESEQVTKDTVTQLVSDAYRRGNADFDTGVLRPLYRLLHEEDRPIVNGKDYGTGPEARMKYITDIVQAREARAATEAVAKAEAEWKTGEEERLKKAREAGRKEALGETNGKEKVDTGSGSNGSGGTSLDEIMSWPTEQRIEFRKQNPQAYNKAIANARK